MPLTFRVAENKLDFARCIYLRGVVFGGDQNILVSEDVDDQEESCRHLLGLDDGEPCCAMRWHPNPDNTAKVERFVVHKKWQGKGVGRALMEFVLADIKKQMPGCTRAILGAQNSAIPFYDRLGFTICSEEYMDAGIPHHMMEKTL